MDVQDGDDRMILSYKRPPEAIAGLAEASLTPGLSLSPDNKWMVILDKPGMPPIEDLASEELRLAGIRINPLTYSPGRASFYTGMSFRILRSPEIMATPVAGLPESAKIQNLSWSADSALLAFTLLRENGLELWVAYPEKAYAVQLTEAVLSDVLGLNPFEWIGGGSGAILFKSIKERDSGPPKQARVPSGPIIQENNGNLAPVHTFQDLLKNPYDEKLFAYYAQSRLVRCDIKTQKLRDLGIEGMISSFNSSPDGKFLWVRMIKRPFSYVVPYSRFGSEIKIFDDKGHFIHLLADLPVADNIPTSIGAVPTGPRNVGWRGDQPATIYWVEAQDGGDFRQEVAIRDKMYCLEAPFEGNPKEVLSLRQRYQSCIWHSDALAVVREWNWPERRLITSFWSPSNPSEEKSLVFDHFFEDKYNDPGNFVMTRNEYGRPVLQENANGYYFLLGSGASPEGIRPFVDVFNPKTYATNRIWQSSPSHLEMPLRLVDADKGLLLISRESRKEFPNLYLVDTETGRLQVMTQYLNPYKELEGVHKELITYRRSDGVELSGTLYLPPGYDPASGKRLPVFMWAYPKEYKSAQAAGQITESPNAFHRLYWGAPVYWALHGYAVFDNFGMPVIGEGEEEPNERFIEQLQMSAQAAVDKLVEDGIADPNRIAVGGHSYGAFMTAHLLAHTNLFAAGIARSGAYNRTLTPFGFQNEERSFWEAPDIYMRMSPFTHADKIKSPLLLIHGEADNNSGTFPMQSERFFAALKGQGATVRLVKLPYESHGYQARESILHMMWEMTEWLDKHVKNKV